MYVTYLNKNTNKYRRGVVPTKQSIYNFLLGNITPENYLKYDYQINEYITKEISNSPSLKSLVDSNTQTILFINKEIEHFIKETCFSEETKKDFYTKFKIPKRKGGYRQLIEPRDDLKKLQRDILDILTNVLRILPHNAAHAFTKNRDAITNAMIHKNSKYVISLDLKDFFPSITEDILRKQLKNIGLFSYTYEHINEFIENIINLATFEGCLPQGSPLSPFLSNQVMLEFDYKIIEKMKTKDIPYYWYTRYADDMTFSSKKKTDANKLINTIKELLKEIFNNKIRLNDKKTKLLKNTGRCFITGAKLNKDNQITIGHEKKKQIKHDLFNLFIAKENGKLSKEQVQSTLGSVAFMKRIEPGYTEYLSKKMLKKFNSNERELSKHFINYL